MISLGQWLASFFSHRFSFQVELVRAVHESVEDGVGEGRVPDDVVPVFDLELAGDHSGADAIAVFGNLEQVAAVLGAELGEAEVVDDQDPRSWASEASSLG